MKAKVSASILLVLLLATTGCGKKADVPHPTISLPGGAEEISSVLSLTDAMSTELAQQTATLYTLEASTDLAKAQAESCFDITLAEAELTSGGGFQVYSTDEYRVSVDTANGYWVYEALNEIPQIAQEVISDEEAKEIACAFVEENQLWDGDFYDIAVTHRTEGGWNSPEVVTSTSVYFYPEVDNHPVVGIFRICITLDTCGNITSVFKQVNKIIDSQQVAILGTDEINRRLEQGDYAAQTSTPLSDASLSGCTLSYYGDGYSVNGKAYLYPVALLSGSGTAPDGTTGTFQIIFDPIA